MSKIAYRISQKAISDLEEIWLYSCTTWSKEQADRYYELLIHEFEYVAKYPTSGRSVAHIREGYRISIIKSHLIFYRILNSEIEIVRILHQSMDMETRFLL